MKEKSKGESFTGGPPDSTHDWVLHLFREGRMQSMLKSYKFDSREQGLALQEVEGDPDKVPFDVTEPSGDSVSLAGTPAFAVKLKRQGRALSRMSYLWTGEVTSGGRSYRVVGTGAQGTLRIPADLTQTYPALLHLRIYGMNFYGKVYALDRNYTLTR